MRPARTAVASCSVLGDDIAEMREHVRACFNVIRLRPKMNRDACDRIVQVPAPSSPCHNRGQKDEEPEKIPPRL
jgi:transposase